MLFLILMIVILYLCFFSMYIILTLNEHTKDIETLYDNYSKELNKLYANKVKRGFRHD